MYVFVRIYVCVPVFCVCVRVSVCTCVYVGSCVCEQTHALSVDLRFANAREVCSVFNWLIQNIFIYLLHSFCNYLLKTIFL